MKFSLSIAFALLITAAATAQTPSPPVVASIAPTVGSTTGGTPVVITGAQFDLPPGFACIAPCPATVVFDKVEVIAGQMTDTRIDVKTPPHAEGLVDITVKTGDGRFLTVPNAFRYTAVTDYEAILLPIYADGTIGGANGSAWKTDLWLRNSGKEDIALAPWPCPEGAACPAVFPLTHILKPGETLHNLPPFFLLPSQNPSRVVYATRGRSARITGALRILDASRAGLNAGTEIPIVRESALQSDTIELHNVPLDSRYRIMLRIYDLALTESRFRVNFYPEDTGQPQPPISSIELTAATPETGEFRVHPAWAQYSALTDLLNLPTIMPPQLRAEIVPLTPGARFWAFISITNNETQHVTLITPQ